MRACRNPRHHGGVSIGVADAALLHRQVPAVKEEMSTAEALRRLLGPDVTITAIDSRNWRISLARPAGATARPVASVAAVIEDPPKGIKSEPLRGQGCRKTLRSLANALATSVAVADTGFVDTHLLGAMPF